MEGISLLRERERESTGDRKAVVTHISALYTCGKFKNTHVIQDHTSDMRMDTGSPELSS